MSQEPASKSSKKQSKKSSMDTVLGQWAHEHPELDLSAMAVIGEIVIASEFLRRGIQKLWAKVGLDFAALDVILTLRRQGQGQALSPSALAKEMMLSSAATTNRLDRLEKRGLIRRQNNPDDRRAIQVVLTSEGFSLAEEMIGPHVAAQQEMMSPLSEEERIQLRTLLLKIKSDD